MGDGCIPPSGLGQSDLPIGAAHEEWHAGWNESKIDAWRVTVSELDADGVSALVGLAQADGFANAQSVKLIDAEGIYSIPTEQGDPPQSSQDWLLYVVVDSAGKMVTAYMADAPNLTALDLPHKDGGPLWTGQEIPGKALIEEALKQVPTGGTLYQEDGFIAGREY